MSAAPPHQKPTQLSYKNISIFTQAKTLTSTFQALPSYIQFLHEASPIKIKKPNITHLEWFPSTSGYKLRVHHQNNASYEFMGFISSQHAEMHQFFLDNYGVEMENTPVSVRGTNWGELEMKESFVSFETEKKEEIFSIGMGEIRNCLAVEKQGELVLEMYDDSEASKYDEGLVEIRFSVPTKEGDYSRIRNMHKHIMKQADVIAEAGEAIVTFSDAPFVAPRGKYTVELFQKFMRLRGKSYDFKILYRDINMMFLLDDPDGRHVYFVIYLGTPVRQGQKQHFHLVMHFDRNVAVDAMKPLKVNLSKEEIAKRYPKQGLKTEMTGKLFQVVAKLFRGITGKKLIGAGDFSSADGSKAVKSSMKVNEGNLFFLQKSIFFLHKPATYIRHDEIAQVSIQRAENKAFHGTRFFDLMVNLRNGKSNTFSNIDKKEEDPIVKYFKSKQIRVEGEVERIQNASGILGAAFGDDDEEEEDEDFEAEDVDEDADEADFEKFVAAPVTNDDAGSAEAKNAGAAGDEKKRKREGDSAEGAPKKKKAKKSKEGGEKKKKTEGGEKKKKSKDGEKSKKTEKTAESTKTEEAPAKAE